MTYKNIYEMQVENKVNETNLEFIGIFVEFIEILKGTTFAIWLKCITYFIAIVLPLVIIMLEKNNIYLLEYI